MSRELTPEPATMCRQHHRRPAAATAAHPSCSAPRSPCALVPSSELQDEEIEDTCPQNIAVKWHAEASSAIYATPLITDLFSDGTKNIVVPAFLHNLEVRPMACYAAGMHGNWHADAWHFLLPCATPAAAWLPG